MEKIELKYDQLKDGKTILTQYDIPGDVPISQVLNVLESTTNHLIEMLVLYHKQGGDVSKDALRTLTFRTVRDAVAITKNKINPN